MAQSLISKHFSQPIGTIVHFGAGRCTELDFYKQAAPDRLILVEANPDLAAGLERRTANMDGAEVIHAAITTSNEQVALKVLSLPEASSLRIPTELIDLFPGIRVSQEVTVEGRLPQDILKEVELDADKENWLIIDIPGEELVTLNQLEESGYLAKFERVVLCCGVSALYENSAPADQSLALLSSFGYEVLELDRDEDPDRPEWLLKRSLLKLENIELHERLTAMQDQIAALTKDRDEQAREAEASGKELEELKSAQAEAEKQATEQIEVLTKERNEQIDLIAELKERVAKLEDERDRQIATTKAQKQEKEQIQSDLSVALRLQSLRNADLTDLQERYSELLDTKKRQDELLDKLQQRLNVAAECLRELNSQGDEKLEENLAQDLVKALSGNST